MVQNGFNIVEDKNRASEKQKQKQKNESLFPIDSI